MNWYLQPWRQYATFTGRAGRKEFWIFYLANLVLGVILAKIGQHDGQPGVIGVAFYLAILLPSLAVTARRLHDIGRSGWWQLLSLVPVIGSIAVLVMCALRGNAASNRFGEAAPAPQ